MTSVPPPYAPRELAQVPQSSSTSSISSAAVQSAPEFSESTAVTLEWRLTGLKSMFDTTKGDSKSKCIKSAVFGDVDNLWEVLFYPNSGVIGGEHASLYLSCTPTPQELESGTSAKWTRKGLWWFRFEIRTGLTEERTGKPAILATKDAADHTFALKTANWGWQQFALRKNLFGHAHVLATDTFYIVCTVQAQAQPPAGYWLGMGLPAGQYTEPRTVVNGRTVGSGGGLSAWIGGEGASGGVAGGTAASGGSMKVVPRDLVSGVGAMLDDPLYSDIEFIIPASRSRRGGNTGDSSDRASSSRRIYANKKLLDRCDYFHAMFSGGFREGEGHIEEDEYDDDLDSLSDSDAEDEAASNQSSSLPRRSLSPRPSSLVQSPADRKTSISGDRPDGADIRDPSEEGGGGMADEPGNPGGGTAEGDTGTEDTPTEGTTEIEVSGSEGSTTKKASQQQGLGKRDVGADRPVMTREGEAAGPRKTKVVVRDAAWSTWWAVLFYLYTDSIYFAPLTSTFTHPSIPAPPLPTHSRPNSITSIPQPPTPTYRTRREWIHNWMEEHHIALSPSSTSGDPLGPRPVSAKAVYRLADKLDLPALKLRAFQHIIAGLTSQNVPAEVFSRFSSTFEDVRKVQVAYFLKHWTEIKKSETMMQIWQQIRVGKHVGFEEVWPLIVGQLDFRPS